MAIYSEILTRTTATGGMVFVTFTPLKGMSEVVCRYLNEPSDTRSVTTMTIDDALHIPGGKAPRNHQLVIQHSNGMPARAGTPMLGSGRVFQVSEESISEAPLGDTIPSYWGKLWGIDFGYSATHAFGDGARCVGP